MLPALMLILGGAVANFAPGAAMSTPAATSPVGTNSTNRPPGPAPERKTSDLTNRACQPADARNIVVCARRPQAYRLDPSVMEANGEVESNNRAASSATPPAQAICSASPMGCGKGLEGLDLANVAVVVATMGIRAAKGEDWTKAFRTGGPNEYQLYQQAKQRREVREADRAAAIVRMKAREAEREAATSADRSENVESGR